MNFFFLNFSTKSSFRCMAFSGFLDKSVNFVNCTYILNKTCRRQEDIQIFMDFKKISVRDFQKCEDPH